MLNLINKKWILILITTVVLLEVLMYNRNYKTLNEETIDVSPDKGVVQTASLNTGLGSSTKKTTTDATPEKKSPISDYFKYFYEGNQEYLKQMSEGRVALSKASLVPLAVLSKSRAKVSVVFTSILASIDNCL